MELKMNKYAIKYKYNFISVFLYTSYSINYILTVMGNVFKNAIHCTGYYF